jgi:hypothetical protein
MHDFLDNLGAQQYEKSMKKNIIKNLRQNDGYYDFTSVNVKNLATLIEDLYSRIEELEIQLKDDKN